MSGVCGNCTIVYQTLEDIGFAVGIASISQFLAKLQVLPVYGSFMAAILNFLLISMSGISGDCTIVFPTFETMDLAVRIVSITQCVAKLQVFPCFPVSSRHLEFSSNIDVAHYRWLHRRVPRLRQ
jgi:hypothetical protein